MDETTKEIGIDFGSGDFTVIHDAMGNHTAFPRRGVRAVLNKWNPKSFSVLQTVGWRKAKRWASKGWAETLIIPRALLSKQEER